MEVTLDEELSAIGDCRERKNLSFPGMGLLIGYPIAIYTKFSQQNHIHYLYVCAHVTIQFHNGEREDMNLEELRQQLEWIWEE